MDIRKDPETFGGSGVGNLTQRNRVFTATCKPIAPPELLARLIATAWTWQRFKTLKCFTVLEALALHHYLEPWLLGFGREQPYAFLDELVTTLRGIDNNPVARLASELPDLRSAVLRGQLRVVRDGEDPLQSLTTADDFVEFVVARGFDSYAQRSWQPRSERLTFSHITPLLLLLSEASQLWTVEAEGGQYVPGWMWTAPRVKQFLMDKGIKDNPAEVMATIVRPLCAAPGRIPMAPEWYEQLMREKGSRNT
jgi:hypothetical protein